MAVKSEDTEPLLYTRSSRSRETVMCQLSVFGRLHIEYIAQMTILPRPISRPTYQFTQMTVIVWKSLQLLIVLARICGRRVKKLVTTTTSFVNRLEDDGSYRSVFAVVSSVQIVCKCLQIAGAWSFTRSARVKNLAVVRGRHITTVIDSFIQAYRRCNKRSDNNF